MNTHSHNYVDMHSSHLSSAQHFTPQSATAPGLQQYSHYQQPQAIHPGNAHYLAGPPSYGSYSYSNGIQSPQSATQPPPAHHIHPQALPLPTMLPGPPSHPAYVSPGGAPSGHNYGQQPTIQHDPTGQHGPPGAKPRMTATLWEDEGSLCFQVEAKGICVARREDNHYINGTKLLNVAGMTRGRRDGILKSEKLRKVVKIGPMHLKGVWIPYDRALEFANKEKIVDHLYPLFVHNIGGLMYNPVNDGGRGGAVAATSEKRRMGEASSRTGQTSHPPSLHHHHSMHSTVGSHLPPTPHSIAPHPSTGRPGLDRAHTFPTPPTSASSVIGMGNQSSPYEWGTNPMGSSVTSTQPLSIDTGHNNARSMPTTPATTPPGSSISNMQPYPGQQQFDDSKGFYSGPPSSQSTYAPHQTPTQQSLGRFGGPMNSNSYVKNEMGPPSAPGTVCGGEADHQHDLKGEPYSHAHVHTTSTDAESDHPPETNYIGASASAYAGNRPQYSYPSSNSGTMQGDHGHLSPDIAGSPHPGSSGRVTPRGANGAHQWQQGYQTPPRAAASSNLYSVMSDSQGSNGNANADHYGSNYAAASINGTSNSSAKRGRDEDLETVHSDRRTLESGYDLKRRKTHRQDAMTMPMGQMPALQEIKTGGGLPRQR